jgi:SAM-dependent methyltransferase
MDFFQMPPRKMLHVAPEAVLEERFRPLLGAGYVTADLLAAKVDVRMDITNIQYPDASFDFIYCSHVLEHVPDDRKAMREFRRVLSSNGVAILTVPITADQTVEDPSIEDPKERLRLFGQEDHVRRYGRDYASRLKEEGFSVTEIRPRDVLTSGEIEKMGITSAAGEIYACKE